MSHEDLTAILYEAWNNPFSTKGNVARAHADHVASAASLGLITSRVGHDDTRTWRITPDGLVLLTLRLNQKTPEEN